LSEGYLPVILQSIDIEAFFFVGFLSFSLNVLSNARQFCASKSSFGGGSYTVHSLGLGCILPWL
jgi:hypothetical protein